MRKLAICIVLTLFLVLFAAAVSADKLEISELTVEVDGDRQSADENGGTVDIIPDSTLKLRVEVKNMYDTGTEGGEIENIEVEAILEEIDDGDDVEEVSDDFDLRPNRDKTVTIEFPIPLRLETDETFKLTIRVEGEDKNNTNHVVELELDVDVDKERHELRFLRKELTPSSVTCADSTRLVLGLINTGEEDEDVELIIDAPELDYNKRMEFEMVEDIDDDDNEFEFSDIIDLDDVRQGDYSVLIRALYRDGRETLEDTLYLDVGSCAADEPEPEPEPEPQPQPEPEPEPEPIVVDVVTPPPTQPSPYVRPATTAVATPRTSYTKQSWWSDNWMVPVLLAALLVLIIAVVVLVVVLLKRRQ